MCEEQAFRAQERMGFIRVPSGVAFEVESLMWITYKLIWFLSSGISVPESVNTPVLSETQILSHKVNAGEAFFFPPKDELMFSLF